MESAAPLSLAGQAACLGAASLWAVSVALFHGPVRQHGARTVNLAKCLLGATLQGLTVLLLGQLGELRAAPASALLFLAGSGLAGLVLGDTALFGAVARIGVHRTLLLQTLSPLFAALIAALWQGERLRPLQLLGAATILGGVALVVAPRRRTPADLADAAAVSGVGLFLGVLAALGQGSGIVLAKVGTSDLPVLSASFVRLAAAAVGLAVLGLADGRLARLGRLSTTSSTVSRLVPATVLGTYVALFLMMAGIAWTPASLAAVLLSTSPVFGLLLERLVYGRPITPPGLLGTLLTVAGVAVLTHG